jgi:hypothetical protein
MRHVRNLNKQEALNLLEDITATADDRVLIGDKHMTWYEKGQLEGARKALRSAFAQYTKWLRGPMQEKEHREQGFSLLVNLLMPVLDIGRYGTVTRSAKNFYAPEIISEIQSRAGKGRAAQLKGELEGLLGYALKLANEIRAKEPDLSQAKLAEAMRFAWGREDDISHERLERHYIPAWEKADLLPKRVPKPKEPARRRR